MAKIPQQNPLSSEIRSPLITGAIEGLNKISSILEMGTTEYENIPLEEVFISDKDRYRIYQVSEDKRLWLNFPNVIIKKNGNIITPTSDFFTIDYIGGSIAFEEQYRLISTDIVTATFTSVSATSNTINSILKDITDLQTKANHDKGFFETEIALETAYPMGVDGDNAIVGETDSLWVWDKETNAWKNSYVKTDLNNYYTKQQADNLLSQKEPTIVAKGTTTNDDNFYYSGTKKWVDLLYKIRNTTLDNLDTSNSEVITEIDNILSAFGKIQGQLNNKVDKVIGLGLSKNDYDDSEKANVAENTKARHTHDNKPILDSITASFTSELKNKLESLTNYDDTVIKQDITNLQNNKANIKKEYQVTVTTNWQVDNTQEIDVIGMVDNGLPLYDLVNVTQENLTEFAKITKLETMVGKIKLTASEPTTINIDIRIEVLY